MRTSVRIIVSCAIAAAAFAAPATALARSPLVGESAGVQLGFGATYPAADGTAATHRGIDLAGEAGDEVVAPLAGEVTFVGRVPGAGGTTVLAVTIRTARGSVTLLPLEQAVVSRGATVAEGQPVAALATGGDASSSATHLHMGLRTGSLYLDPTGMLTPPVATRPNGAEQPATAEEPAGATEGVAGEAVAGGALGGVVSGATVAPGVTVSAGGAVSAPAGAGDAASAGAAAMALGVAGAGVAAGMGASGADAAASSAEVAPGVTLAGSGEPVSEGLRATGVLADAGETISTGAKVARVASSAVRDGRLGSALSRGMKMAGRGARGAALLATGLLCAVGALWPLWRAGGMEGLGKVPVSAIGDDVAAVASR